MPVAQRKNSPSIKHTSSRHSSGKDAESTRTATRTSGLVYRVTMPVAHSLARSSRSNCNGKKITVEEGGETVLQERGRGEKREASEISDRCQAAKRNMKESM